MVFAGGNGDPRDGADDAPLVLVIEDEPTQRTMLMRVLEREGYRAIGLADVVRDAHGRVGRPAGVRVRHPVAAADGQQHAGAAALRPTAPARPGATRAEAVFGRPHRLACGEDSAVGVVRAREVRTEKKLLADGKTEIPLEIRNR